MILDILRIELDTIAMKARIFPKKFQAIITLVN